MAEKMEKSSGKKDQDKGSRGRGKRNLAAVMLASGKGGGTDEMGLQI